ncbi:MAG TPA: hypothetical protein VEC02_03625 [Nitrososphaerales archaeon]|nr:hypothetical protein [Nitrososphaerales archaeon]
MIRVRLIGHIRTSVGVEEVEFQDDRLGAGAMVERLRSMCREEDPGFNSYNTLAMIEEGDAFVPAASEREIRSGDRVVLIPFSHGG